MKEAEFLVDMREPARVGAVAMQDQHGAIGAAVFFSGTDASGKVRTFGFYGDPDTAEAMGYEIARAARKQRKELGR